MNHYLINVYHSYDKGRVGFAQFLDQILSTLKGESLMLGLNYAGGNVGYSLSLKPSAYPSFESAFYSHFQRFQVIDDSLKIRDYDPAKTIIGELRLENTSFGPLKFEAADHADVMSSLMRTMEGFDLGTDKVGIFVGLKPQDTDKLSFQMSSGFAQQGHSWNLAFKFYKYMRNRKVESNRKQKASVYYKDKINADVFRFRFFIICQSSSIASAKGKIKALFNNYSIFANFPYNEFQLHFHEASQLKSLKEGNRKRPSALLTSGEISTLFSFPSNPKAETSLIKAMSVKLSLPSGVPTFGATLDRERNEIVAKDVPADATVLGITDYRSIKVPIGIYMEDRLRHMYIIGKSGVGKSKLIQSMMIDDMYKGNGFAVIDPHGDLVDEVLMHIPESRRPDVIIFDPSDAQFPFCLNPLDVKQDESKQVLAKGFIDIFKKFFGANRNSQLEHVLRMVFLALLDKKDATLFDIIRALTDKDFRYAMIEQIGDDVVRNFWTNEFAGRSQQFNTQAIMPILNKVGQLLSIDVMKNIFGSPENKLDFREVMDQGKILLIKVAKGKLQEEIMGFLGAMFVTKLYQTAMGRQNVQQSERRPFFLYVDEFQNFATETFGEILSEARKYGLGLVAAHQFIKQIPPYLSDALFGNTGTLISFRISSEDSLIMQKHFEPGATGYDLANLNQREFYCKMIVKGQAKDTFSVRTMYTPDVNINPQVIQQLVQHSRQLYNRSLAEVKAEVQVQQADVIEKIEEFAEPLI